MSSAPGRPVSTPPRLPLTESTRTNRSAFFGHVPDGKRRPDGDRLVGRHCLPLTPLPRDTGRRAKTRFANPAMPCAVWRSSPPVACRSCRGLRRRAASDRSGFDAHDLAVLSLGAGARLVAELRASGGRRFAPVRSGSRRNRGNSRCDRGRPASSRHDAAPRIRRTSRRSVGLEAECQLVVAGVGPPKIGVLHVGPMSPPANWPSLFASRRKRVGASR